MLGITVGFGAKLGLVGVGLAALIAGVCVAISMPCLLVWAGIGTAAAPLLQSPGQLRVFDIDMAVLLVLSLVPTLR